MSLRPSTDKLKYRFVSQPKFVCHANRVSQRTVSVESFSQVLSHLNLKIRNRLD